MAAICPAPSFVPDRESTPCLCQLTDWIHWKRSATFRGFGSRLSHPRMDRTRGMRTVATLSHTGNNTVPGRTGLRSEQVLVRRWCDISRVEPRLDDSRLDALLAWSMSGLSVLSEPNHANRKNSGICAALTRLGGLRKAVAKCRLLHELIRRRRLCRSEGGIPQRPATQ